LPFGLFEQRAATCSLQAFLQQQFLVLFVLEDLLNFISELDFDVLNDPAFAEGSEFLSFPRI